MKKRVLSLVLAFVLSFSMMPMSAFAEEAGTVTEQETQNSENTADVSTTGEDTTGEDTAETSATVEDISGGNAVTKDTAVEAAQALINALPEEVTAENAGELQAQLMAIDEALAALDEAQTAKLDMTRLENICAALNGAVAVQAGEHNNTHPICGATCTYNDESHLLPAGKEWQAVSTLTDSMAAGYYYLTNDVTLEATWTPKSGTVLDLNGHSITVNADVDAITVPNSCSFTLTDCNSSGSVHYFTTITEKYNLWEPVETGGGTTVTGGVITHSSGKNGSGIFMEGNGTFTMYGGTICGNYNSTAAGAGVRATKSKIIMSGGAISGNVAGSSDSNKNGGGVYLSGDGSSFDMSGNAKITDNTAKGLGGGVSMTGGAGGKVSFTMSGNAKITGNMCTGSACGGAGLYASDGEFTMNDNAAISGNCSLETRGYGGGVFVSKSATFTMNGSATISGNSAYVASMDNYRKNSGGGVQVLGTFIMNGGSISDNMAENGAGVYVGLSGSIPGTFTMNGGTITNNKVIGGNGGGVYVLGNFRIANGASVKANLCDSKANNVYLSDGKTIEITRKLTDANNVGVTVENLPTEINNPVTVASGDGTYTVDDSDEKAFFADADGYNVYYDKGELKLYNGTFHKHKVCVDTNCENCSHDSVIWEPISNEKDLRGIDTSKGKYYYLTDDITLTGNSPWCPENDVVLDLCGNSIIGCAGEPVIYLANYGTFKLTDCKGSKGTYGKITHAEGEFGAGIGLKDNAQLHFYGGSISGNQSDTDGGGAYVDSGSKLYMYGGEIVDNYTSRNGGGVCLKVNSKFYMYGGRIANNKATRAEFGGGGVCVRDILSFITVRGNVEITGNKYVDADGTTEGTSNVYCRYNNTCKITVDGQLSSEAKIGIDNGGTWVDRNIAKATDGNTGWIQEDNFTSDNSFYKVVVDDNGTTASLKLHDHKWGVKAGTEENILVECCTVDGCDVTGGTLTLKAVGGDYDGTPYKASLEPDSNWHGSKDIKISYEKQNSDGTFSSIAEEPTARGTYRASITVDGVIARKEFTINGQNLAKDDFTFNKPDNLTYDSNPKTATVTPKPSVANYIGDITVEYYDEKNQRVAEPTDAGTYTVKINVTDGVGFKEVSGMTDLAWTFTIVPKPVTITGALVKDKVYDGTDKAEIEGTPAIEGLVDGDEADVMVDTSKAKATFEDANAGESKTVTFGGYALTGTKAGNYTLSAQPASVTADITPKELTITNVMVEAKAYDGTTTATVTGVTFNGLVNSESLTKDRDYTVTGNFGDVAVGENKNVAVTVKLADSVKNYTLSDTWYTKSSCKIVKAAVAAPAATNLTIINGSSTIYTVMLPQLLPSPVSPGEYGKLTYNDPQLKITDSSYDGAAEVRRSEYEYGKLALQFNKTGTTEGPIGTITVTVHSDNYQDITLTINILATAKIVPQLEGTLKLTPSEITYGEKLSNITISGTMTANGKEITGTFAWQNPDDVLNAGNQQAAWKFTPDNTQTYAETTGTTTVKVNRAEQSGAVLMYNYTYNETPATPALTEQKGDNNATVTYYYSTTRTNSGGTEWKNIGPTTLNAGTYYMYAVIGETGNFNKYTTDAKAFTVWTAEPAYTKPSGLTAKYGQKLSEIKLSNPAGNMSGTWSWEAPDTVIDKTGTVSYGAVFTPSDTNYNEVVTTIEITVTPGDGRNLATEELTLAFNDSADHTYTPDWSGLPAGQTWNYECESSISNGSKATLTKLNVAAADGELTYAVSDGKAGDEITVILKARCNNYEDFTITLNIQITKAAPAGEPKYTLITTGGKTLADAGLTLNGSTLNPAAGTLEWVDADGNVLSGDTEVEVNKTYKWRFTPADTNYNTVTGEIELYHVDAPAISAQPKSVSVTVGEKATFEVTATGTDVTYQWKIDRNDGNGFVDITGATGAAYTTGVTDKDCDGFKYQCVIRNAAGSATTDTVVLTVLYQIIEGANGSWNQNTDGGSLKIRGNGEYSKFQNVKVDGNIIDSKNYTVSEGSTIIELHADYLKTLSEGSHTFEIVWTDGAAGTSFTVARNTSGSNSTGSNNTGNNDNNDSTDNSAAAAPTAAATAQELDKVPATGDASGIWIALFVVSAVGLAAMLVRRKKQ